MATFRLFVGLPQNSLSTHSAMMVRKGKWIADASADEPLADVARRALSATGIGGLLSAAGG